MRVLLDEKPIEVTPATIANALETGREAAAERGRIVIEVLGDGVSVGQDLIEKPPHDSAGFTELKLVTADPGAFISVTLSDTIAILNDADDAQKKAADLVMAGDREAAFGPLQQAMAAWAVARDVVDKSAALLNLEMASIRLDGGTGADAVASLAKRLTDIKRALTEQDDSALADTLAYDMPGEISAWRALLTEMQRLASKPAGGHAGPTG